MSGYVPADEYETKRQHRQLNGMMLCSRCSDLSHGRMVNAVAGQGGAKLSAGLITPSELREQLTRIRDEKVLVVKVVDATDFHGSFLNRVRDVVGANPILLVLTKVDLLPRGTDLDALGEWAANEVTVKRRLTLAGVVCVSSRRGVGMREAVGAMFAERKGRDVYVLGSANVGKSTFIRAALKAMREGGNYGVPGKRLPTASAMPGTTLGVIPLRAFEGRGVMYDTPGVFLHHRMNSILSGEDIKRFKLGNSLKKYAPPPRVEGEETDRESFAGLSLLWGALLRVDITEATANANLTFYGPKGMRVAVVETASLPDPEALEAAADLEREAHRAANREGAEEGAEDGAEDATPLAPSAMAAVEAARAENLRSPALVTPYGDAADPEADDILLPGTSAEYETARDETSVFHQRLVREARFDSREGEDGYGALADLSVSGMNGWIRVSRTSRRDDCAVRVKVWGPRGLEVFVREPMPIGGA